MLEREEIYSRLWGYAMVRGDRSVDVFVRKLRQKLEKASPSGATSTPTSASATASPPNRSRSSAATTSLLSLPLTRDAAAPMPPPAIRASSAGRSSDQQLAAGALDAHRSRGPPSSDPTRAPVSSGDDVEKSGSWPTSSTRAVAATAGQRLERVAGIEAAGQRRVAVSSRARAAPGLGGQPGGLGARAPWGCTGPRRSSTPSARERDARVRAPGLPALGQTALGVRAGAVGLGLPVT